MLRIYNSLTRHKEEFKPLEEGKVSMYVCGPTVYADAHVGHAMSAMVFDVVHRYLEYRGYDVKYASNFTDVDDKIIRRANESNQNPTDLAAHFSEKYLAHLKELNVLPADVYPKVSTEMDNIIKLIGELGEGGYAYDVDGDVYFRVKQDDDYGKLSGRALEDALSGTRVEEDGRKEHPGDFALWKSAKPGEPQWESPWGPGRPGWHIECSAMCLHHLGETIDIHGGGNDLVFPHHENEIAQSESFTGKPFSQVWMHHGMLQLAGEKMSKSTGNIISIEEFLEDRTPCELRMLIFAGHYRKPVMFTNESLDGAKRSLERLLGGLRASTGDRSTGEEADALRQATEQARIAFIEAMDDDFNTSMALAAMFGLVTEINKARGTGVSGPFFVAAQTTLQELGDVLGLKLMSTDEHGSTGGGADVGPFVELLIKVRKELRSAKQFELSDMVRNELSEIGVTLEDSREGTTWRFED